MSITELVPKPTAQDEIRNEAVKILREALEKAESGDVASVLIIVKHADNTWSDYRSGVIGFPEFIGRLEITKQAWINSYLREPQ